MAGNCIFGLSTIDLYFFRVIGPDPPSFLFNFSGNTITDLSYANVYGVHLNATCFAVSAEPGVSASCLSIEDEGTNAGVIVGSVVASVVILLIIGVACFCIFSWMRSRNRAVG